MNKKKNHIDTSEDNSRALLEGLSFCVIDLETTGGDHNYDKIIEIGLVRVENFKIINEMSYLVKPEIPIPDFVQRLTSIKENTLKKAPTIEKIIDKITNFIGSSIIVAHNASFDVPFLNSVLDRLKKPILNNPTICTNLMIKNLIPELMNSNLTYVGQLFNIPHKKAHRALEDARVTALLLMKLLTFFVGKGIKKVNHLYYPRKKFELDSKKMAYSDNINSIVAEIKEINTPLVITIKGEKGNILSVLPIKMPSKEISFIEKKLTTIDWKNINLKIFGSIFKSFSFFNQYFTQIPNTEQQDILSYLDSKYIKQSESSKKIKNKGSFLVCHHLIKDQFSIFFTNDLFLKTELIFRYPAHEKKLYQFINNKIKSQKIKKRKITISYKLKKFYRNYFDDLKENAITKEYFYFDQETFVNKPRVFKSLLVSFLSQENKNYEYPKMHI